MAKTFKVALAVGQESTTDEYFVDAAGVEYPIYAKRLAIDSLPNNTTKNFAHGVTGIKLNGHFDVRSLQASSGAAGATARTNRLSSGITASFDGTNVIIGTGSDLSAQGGTMVIEYCKIPS